MTTSARPNANVSPTSGAATMYTTIWTSPFRRIFPRMTAGRSPASRPARIVVPSVGRCLRMMTSYAKNDAAPSTNAIPVTKRKRSMFVVLGRRIDPGPTASTVEPMMPPMSAWLLDVGRPHSHVTRSHTIAPTTPPMMMAIEWWNAASPSGRAFTPRMFVSMIPLPIVSAIAFVMKTIPTKLPAAAMATAFVGVRTFVATKVLTPTKAVAMAAAGNFVGMVFITNAIAETIGKGIIDTNILGVNALPLSHAAFFHSMAIIMGGVVGAIVWDLITWVWGLPTSSSHALIGGLIGASALAAGPGSILLPSTTNMLLFLFVTGMAFVLGAASYFAYDVIIRRHRPTLGTTILAGLLTGLLPAVILGKILLKGLVQIVVYMVAAPLVGLTFAFGLALVVIRLFRRHTPTKVNHEFKRLQLVSSFFYSVTHGTNDAQKGMGIITLILVVAAIGPPWGPPSGQFAVPFWVILGAHASISLGTFFGGWRIVRTMSQRVTHLRPWQGFSAETGGGIALASSALAGIPVSTTHVIASAIMGVGATKRLSAVRWGVARRIFWAWIITIPASAGVGMAAYGVMRLMFGV